MEYVIETLSLTKTFSDWWGRNKVYAVDDLNLRIHSNEVFGLLGPNGSGKTTTIKLLLGLLRPTKGRALVFGGDSTDPKINARIGFLPEESYLYRYLTARETLNFYGRLFGLPSRVRKDRIEALLDMVGLRAVANRQVGTFSKGMARRIGLAQALINDPDLLILDEPTNGLDPIGTRQIKDLIITLAKRGKTILLSSHLLADVEDVCDRIAILYGGKVQVEGKVKDLLEQTGKKQITAAKLSDSALRKIETVLEAEHADYVVDTPLDKLETFFIRTVADAQQQSLLTSGAVSTTAIGDFLSAGTEKKSEQAVVLENLVSGSEAVTAPAKTLTSKPVLAETSSNHNVDKKLLVSLTSEDEPGLNKPQDAPTTTPVKPVDQNPDESVLEQLTDRDNNNSKGDDKKSSDKDGDF